MNSEVQEAEQEVTDQVDRLSINAVTLSMVAQRLYEKVGPLLSESIPEESGEIAVDKDVAVCSLAAEICRHNDNIESAKARINAIINRIEINKLGFGLKR